MDTNKILSADLLDIIFDNRNKEYGAYHLRVTYERRVKKSLFLTCGVVLLAFSGFAFSNKQKPENIIATKPVVRTIEIPLAEEVPPPVAEQPKKADPPQRQTEELTNITFAKPNEDPETPPDQEDLKIAVIGSEKTPGDEYGGVQGPSDLTSSSTNDIIVDKKPVEPEIRTKVEIDAKFKGNWEKFLLRNLRPEAPADNGAPVGRYTVIIQFVVSLDGTVSDIKPLTKLGYGLEEEAVRVIKKSENWEPAIQNGYPVKAYRKQPIVFVVEEN